MKWKLEYCDNKKGLFRTVYIYPGAYMLLIMQSHNTELIELEIVNLYNER